MTDKKIQLQIVTPEKIFFDEEVNMVILRSKQGDLGVLHGHEALVTTLDIGMIRMIRENREKQATVHGGFAEIQPEKVTVLTDAAEWPEDIDVERAKAARKRAEERLNSKQADMNILRAKAALRRALLRIEVGGKEEL